MDINHIQLPASLVADLYTNTLVETGDTPATSENSPGITSEDLPKTWKWLGENKKNILVVVRHTESVHLPDDELNFLTNMLNACQLGLADVAIVNLTNQPHTGYKEITDQFRSRVALLFDVEPASFGLPMNFPYFQIQPFADCSFLYAPSLTELDKDKVLKSKLWVVLRRLFNI